MMTGEFRVVLDDKGRLLIPTKLRNEMIGDTIVLTKGIDKCLCLYTPLKWEVFSKAVQESLGVFNPRDLRIQRLIIGSAMELEIDKAGRIGISAILREHANLSKDCHVVGMRNFIEIWDEKTYMDYQNSLDIADLSKDLTFTWPKE
jgi:MraZ protein